MIRFDKAFSVRDLLLLVIVLFATQPAAYAWNSVTDDSRQNTIQAASVDFSITSGIGGMPESARAYNSGISADGEYTEGNPDKKTSFGIYITPDDPAVQELAARISAPKDAYAIAAQWIYVSDQKLNQVADKWMIPHDFLTCSPDNVNNPLKSKVVGDCEEKANTLVSLIRAKGARPEEVRVALGEVIFNDIKTGHAWVELLTDGLWLSLDPCWGSYWDDKAGKLVRRAGVPFEYYASHTYPVLQAWIYYNDMYFLDPRDGSGNAPESWLNMTRF